MFEMSKILGFARAKTGHRYDRDLRSYMISVYNYMTVALIVTGLVAFFINSTPALQRIVYTSGLLYLCMFANIGIAFYMQYKVSTATFQTLQTLYWVYCALMGVWLAPILLVYTGASIIKTFFISATVFGVSSIYGYLTKRDLISFGSILMTGLIGIIVASLVNLFLRSPAIDFSVSLIAVVLFTVLIAYHNQQLKWIYYKFNATGNNAIAAKLGIIGALSLYTAFINLFLSLLRFVGRSRD